MLQLSIINAQLSIDVEAQDKVLLSKYKSSQRKFEERNIKFRFSLFGTALFLSGVLGV